VDEPLQVDHCGTCTACLDACPTGALTEPRVLDAGRCIGGLTVEHRGTIPAELRSDMGDWIFGCDICQEVCPWNRHAPGSSEPTFQPRHGVSSLPLADLLRLDERGFRMRFKGSALIRAKRTGLLRSAAIALGNRPHPDGFAALDDALDDADPVIRAAAAWALGRWIAAEFMPDACHAALERRREVEDTPTVIEEIAGARRSARISGQGHSTSRLSTSDGSTPGESAE
jgi:epoxyqueuosine reductase